jgi:hypothetical protein
LFICVAFNTKYPSGLAIGTNDKFKILLLFIAIWGLSGIGSKSKRKSDTLFFLFKEMHTCTEELFFSA